MATKELRADLQNAINEHLPSMLAGELRQRLDEADGAIKSNVELREKLAETEVKLRAAQGELSEHEALGKVRADLERTDRELTDRRLEMDKTILEVRLEEANLRAEMALDALSGIVRNTVVRQRVHGTVPLAVDGYDGGQYNAGGPGFVSQGQVDTTTEETVEYQ